MRKFIPLIVGCILGTVLWLFRYVGNDLDGGSAYPICVMAASVAVFVVETFYSYHKNDFEFKWQQKIQRLQGGQKMILEHQTQMMNRIKYLENQQDSSGPFGG